ncbi:helix-turn-helix domain-containing protein [Ferrimonas pelagia]|uniref:Uncharacterized protein n=1 Tax=Ferrimonas pelagia TaxID=1177826 RepID=A0ABP9FI85_9GAMM
MQAEQTTQNEHSKEHPYAASMRNLYAMKPDIAFIAKQYGVSTEVVNRACGITATGVDGSAPQDAARRCYLKQKEAQRELVAELKRIGYKVERFTQDEVTFMVSEVLDGLTASEAMNACIKKFERCPEWVSKIKHKQHRGRIKRALNETEQHCTQQDAKRLGIMTRSDKADVINSTMNSALNKLAQRKSIIDKFNAMEARQREAEQRIAELEARMGTVEGDVVSAGGQAAERKAQAIALKSQGWAVNRIAEHLKVNRKTISRYLNS